MTSGIALTKYIYPVKQPITFSLELGYSLDNPRTEQEIELIKNFISPSLKAEGEKSMAVKVTPAHIRIGLNLEYLINYLSQISNERYAYEYYRDIKESDILEVIAKSWIIIRFNSVLDIDKILNSTHYLRILSLDDDEKSDYNEQIYKLSSYCQILSLFAFNDERIPYLGQSFLLNPSHPFEVFFTSINQELITVLDRYASSLSMLNPEVGNQPILGEYWWLSDRDSLINWATKLENLIKQRASVKNKKGNRIPASQMQALKEKLIHVGERLKIAYEHMIQPELPVLLLVGNIEYLLTRNPDTNRFNVEDSISRQFKLKCGIAINEADPSMLLEGLNKELSNIYSLRSDFAHGNYTEKCDKWNLYKVVADLFKYTRAILIAYLKNKALIDYLKDN